MMLRVVMRYGFIISGDAIVPLVLLVPSLEVAKHSFVLLGLLVLPRVIVSY